MNARKALVLAMVVILSLGVATAAYATWADSTYLTSWVPSSETPHGNYDTASSKCGVCHAVHGAKLGGEKLLQSTAADSCTYCHITSNLYVTVYGGDTANYTSATNLTKGHTNLSGGNTATTGVGCSNCHTVHGGGTATMGGNPTNLLALSSGNTYVSARSGYEAAGYAKFGNIANLTEWCSGCHPYYNTGLNGRTHVMRSFTTTYTIAGSATNKVAWAGSNDCTSCHDSSTLSGAVEGNLADGTGPGLFGKAFPHFTDGARFMNVAAEWGGASSAATDTTMDSACLKCHVDGTTSGVGFTY